VTRVQWFQVDAIPPVANEDTLAVLRRIDILQSTWVANADIDPEAFERTRLRTIRSHAVETGILERLYDLDWGVTQALVADGLLMSVAEREGGIEASTLDVVKSQFDALEYVSEFAAAQEPLSVTFIRNLHASITKHQSTYEAMDSLGRRIDVPLQHGQWKQNPNQVERMDGSVWNYCPPEFVQDEIERLIQVYNADTDSHPLVRAAWLHHRFISIHPFDDGNGRVARALVLLELLRAHYAPLVVDRTTRDAYIRSLESANDGNLEPLVVLFAELERIAMAQQFQEPLSPSSGVATQVVTSWAQRFRDAKNADEQTRAAHFNELALGVQSRIEEYLKSLATQISSEFRDVDPGADAWVNVGRPGQENAMHYQAQIVQLAKKHDFYANRTDGTWWTALRFRMRNETLTLLVPIIKVGYGESGWGTVAIQAESAVKWEAVSEGEQPYRWLFQPQQRDQVPFTTAMSVDDIWPDVLSLVDSRASAAINSFLEEVF
jgi:hypothetical protein